MKKVFLFAVLLFFIIGCGKTALSTPKEVAEAFWKAFSTNDMESVKELVIYKDEVESALADNLKIVSYKIETVSINEEKTKALAKTVLVLAEGKNDKETQSIVFDTVLLKIGEDWKVDFQKTYQNFFEEVAKRSAKELTNTIFSAFVQGMKNVKQMQKAFEEGFKEINKELQKAFKEMEEELKKMEEANSTGTEI